MRVRVGPAPRPYTEQHAHPTARGSITLRDKTWLDGRRLWWTKPGSKDPHELPVEDVTAIAVPLLGLIQGYLKETLGINKPLEGEALGGLPPDAGKLGELLDELVERVCGEEHGALSSMRFMPQADASYPSSGTKAACAVPAAAPIRKRRRAARPGCGGRSTGSAW